MKADINNLEDLTRKLIDYLKQTDADISEEVVNRKWEELLRVRLKKQQIARRRKYVYALGWSCAALLAGLVWYVSFPGKDAAAGCSSLDQAIANVESVSADSMKSITLMTDENHTIRLTPQDKIAYSSQGHISINHKTMQEGTEEAEYSQLIVPKGKTSRIKLSDGSTLYVNAGTKVVYPNLFTGKHREIYADGEICVDVAKDASRPFIVQTPSVRVKVLGTMFNVRSQKSEMNAEVVLLRGAVAVSSRSTGKEYRMQPNELLEITEKEVKKMNVAASSYIEWIYNRMSLSGKLCPKSSVIWKTITGQPLRFLLSCRNGQWEGI